MVREDFHSEKMATKNRKQEDLYHSCIFKIQKQHHIIWDQRLQTQKQHISLFFFLLPSHPLPCDYTSPHQNQPSKGTQQQKAAFSCTSHRAISIFSSSLHAETATLHWQCTGCGMGTQPARALPLGPPQQAQKYDKRCISDTGCQNGLSQSDARWRQGTVA